MFNISLYLERFKDIQDPSIVKNTIKKTIEETIQGSLGEGEIVFEKNNITIRCDAYIRSEIFIHSEKIKENLKDKGVAVISFS